jgi:hypothetical protein
MPRHKDFEIWFDEETQRYRFSVEYWGGYGAKTLEEIELKVKVVRNQVKARLREIDAQNKAYYAKLARQEYLLKQALKEHRDRSSLEEEVAYSDLHPSEQRIVRRMIRNGADELEIKNKFNIKSTSIGQLRRWENENVCNDIPKDEIL